MPTQLHTNMRPRRPRILPVIAYWATFALMIGTACLGVQLVRDIIWQVSQVEIPAIQTDDCGTVVKDAPKARRAGQMRMCLMLQQYQGF